MPGAIKKFTKTLSITFCIITGVCMLLLYLLPYLPRFSTWFLDLIALCFPFLILIQLLFLLLWLLRKKKLAIMPFLFLLFSWKLIGNFFPFHFFRSTASDAHEKNRFTVMSWNVRYFNFYNSHESFDEVIISKIKNMAPDVAALQEVMHAKEDIYPYALDSISNRLGFAYAATAGAKKEAPYQKFSDYFNYCVTIFSRYPIIHSQLIDVANNRMRNFFYADIVKGKDTIRILNVHLQSRNYSQNEGNGAAGSQKQADGSSWSRISFALKKMRMAYLLRSDQADAIHKTVAASPYPVILCGDLNDVPNSYSYQVLKKNLADAHVTAGSGIGSTYQYILPTLRIDYIFYSRQLKLTRFLTDKSSVSDHYPVLASFETDK